MQNFRQIININWLLLKKHLLPLNEEIAKEILKSKLLIVGFPPICLLSRRRKSLHGKGKCGAQREDPPRSSSLIWSRSLGRTRVSSYPHIRIHSYPHILIYSYPHILIYSYRPQGKFPYGEIAIVKKLWHFSYMAIYTGNLPHVFSPAKTFAFQLWKSESMPWKRKQFWLLET